MWHNRGHQSFHGDTGGLATSHGYRRSDKLLSRPNPRPREIFLPPREYPLCAKHESWQPVRILEQGYRQRGGLNPEIFPWHYNIRTPFSQSDRVICRALISDFYVATCLSFCNKFLAL
jgi:hypothetical protein